MHRIAFSLMCVGLLCVPAFAQEKDKDQAKDKSPNTPAAAATQPTADSKPNSDPNPNAWSERTYRFSAYDLVLGFQSRDQGRLIAPPRPDAGAKPEKLQQWLRKSHAVASQYLLTKNITLPKGSLIAFDPKTVTLAARTTNAHHAVLAQLSEDLANLGSRGVRLTFKILEGKAGDVREALKDAQKQADHTPALARIEALVEKKEAKFISQLTGETRSGQRSKVESVQNRSHITSFSVDEREAVETTFNHSDAGVLAEFDPVIGEDNKTIDLNVALEYHFAPPSQRPVPSGQVGPRVIESSMTDFHRAKVVAAITAFSGMTKLLGVWSPDGINEGDRLQAAFVTPTIAKIQADPDPVVAELLKAHGPAVEPIPAVVVDPPSRFPAGMAERKYRIGLHALATEQREAKAAESSADPFSAAPPNAPPEPTVAAKVTVQELLVARGFLFPKGATAAYNSALGELTVVNTPQNLELLDDWIAGLLKQDPTKTVGLSFYIVQADGPTIRRMAADAAFTGDHSALWKKLEAAAAQGAARIVRSGWIETRSGQRCKCEAVVDRMDVNEISLDYQSGAADSTSSPANTDAKDKAEPRTTNNIVRVTAGGRGLNSAETTINSVGTTFEVDPVIGEDGRTIDLNLAIDHDFAPPTERFAPVQSDAKTLRINSPGVDFHRAKLTTALTMIHGTARLVGVWKPSRMEEQGKPNPDDEDILQVVFIQVNILPCE